MTTPSRAVTAAFLGALTTNVVHEILRRIVPAAPRIDLLGMQALAKMYRAADADPPRGRSLYVRTLLGDVASNAAYFSLSAFAGANAPVLGTLLGIAAGIGAFLIPPAVGLDEKTTGRNATTKLLTIFTYGVGGAVTGFAFVAMDDDADPTD